MRRFAALCCDILMAIGWVLTVPGVLVMTLGLRGSERLGYREWW